jgi:NADPH:quinone reductase-like Zn-dependent oxidoreductase
MAPMNTTDLPASRVVRIHRTGPPEVMQLESLVVGEPGAGELRLKVEAIGLNRAEAMYRAGHYFVQPTLPGPLGYEAAGIVEVLGAGVSGFAPGERVCVLPSFRLGQYGVYAERAIVPARSCIATPPRLSPSEAASIWMQYFTAFGIVEAGRAGVGDYVLVPAASSSVGLAAIQIANWVGAEPIALTRHSAKAARLLALGARHVIASSEADVVAEVLRITGGRGANVVFDPVGGPFVETLAKAMADDGTLIIYGGLSGQATPYPHWSAAMKSLSLRGWVASYIWDKPDRFEAVKGLILRGLVGGQLRPVIDRTFALDDIVAAHRYLESNEQVGKVVVTVP